MRSASGARCGRCCGGGAAAARRGLAAVGVPCKGIEFDTIAAQVALKGGTVTVQRFAAGGALGTASGEGTVLVRMAWSESILNLTLKLSPPPGAAARVPLLALAGTKGGPITVHIGGRLARPDVTLNGRLFVPFNGAPI